METDQRLCIWLTYYKILANKNSQSRAAVLELFHQMEVPQVYSTVLFRLLELIMDVIAGAVIVYFDQRCKVILWQTINQPLGNHLW
jgi:hypothetical protein